MKKATTKKNLKSLCQKDKLAVRYPHVRTNLPGLFCVGNVNEFVPFFVTVHSLVAHNFPFFLTKAGICYKVVAELVKVGDFLLVYRRVFDHLLHKEKWASLVIYLYSSTFKNH